MARRQVLEIKCDRCDKVETQEIPKGGGDKSGPELTISFRGQSTTYDDMCLRCRNACENYFKSISKQLDKDPESPEPAPAEEAEKKGGLLGRVGIG